MAQTASSTIITNRDATPKVLTDAYISGGDIRESAGFVQTPTSTDAVGSTYKLCTVPSCAKVTSLILQADAMAGSAAVNVGIAWPTSLTAAPGGASPTAANAGTIILATAFASAISVVSALPGTELITRANLAINKHEQQLWKVAGLTSDPGMDLDIWLTVSTVFAAQGYLILRARYMF